MKLIAARASLLQTKGFWHGNQTGQLCFPPACIQQEARQGFTTPEVSKTSQILIYPGKTTGTWERQGRGNIGSCRSLSKYGYFSSQVGQHPCLKVMARSWPGLVASQSAPESWMDPCSSWEQPGSHWQGCFAVRSPAVLFSCIYFIFQAESFF